MKNLVQSLVGLLVIILCTQVVNAQDISVYQYRHVPQDKVDEFIYREVNYWQKVAQKAIDDGKLKFWGLFQKVGVYDMPNTSNFLFINTVSDVDAGGIWNPESVFPNVPMDEMETNSMSTVTSQLFVRPENWVDDEGATPSEDYNYVRFNYWNPSDPQAWIDGEKEHWEPFIKAEMAKEATSQVAWGNATILAPENDAMKSRTISFDIYPTLHSALIPQYDENAQFPEDALSELWDNLLNPRGMVIYRIVAVANSDN
jgi:hypothetical protein